ncbi:hypothetical protein ACFL6K_04050 [Candidatus Latescibacterota bacterium]
MKYISIILILLSLFSVSVSAQGIRQFDVEPTEEELGAPIFPGAVYIRKSIRLNQNYETAIYISSDPIDTVKIFFAEKLSEKRVINISEDDTSLTAYLLKTSSKFPDNPTKDELVGLENEPTIQIIQYDPTIYESLAAFFERSTRGETIAETIRNGKTMLRYTYPRTYKNTSSEQVVATWRETSRGLREFYGSTLKFNDDGTYIFTLTTGNISELAQNPALIKILGLESEEDVRKHLEEKNPETGKYALMRTSITMVSDNPFDGQRIKRGQANVGPVMLSLSLINKPRLTFLKSRIRRTPPGIQN